MKTALFKDKTTELVKRHSPQFENEMDPIEMMEILDGMQQQLSNNPNESTAQFVRETLQDLQVLTFEHNGKQAWITKPMTYALKQSQPSTARRIIYLFKTGTQWIKARLYSEIEGNGSISIPMMLEADSTLKDISRSNDIIKLKCSVIALRETIHERIRSGENNIGIFQSPNGVVNMNLLNAWLEENSAQDGSRWTNHYPLTLVTLDQIADSVVFENDTII